MDLFSARISPSACIAESVDYDTLLEQIAEYTLRAAFAHAVDQHDWNQEELRRKGLRALELFHNGRAVWRDRVAFEESQAEVDALRGIWPVLTEPTSSIRSWRSASIETSWNAGGWRVI